jgi:hypothetical protein
MSSGWREFARQSGYFHLHATVPANQVTEEIRRYHAGILPVWSFLANLPDPSHTDAAFKYGTSARNISYLEAGLLTLLPRQVEYQLWLFKRYGVALEIAADFLDDADAILRRALGDPTLPEKVRRAQSALSIDGQIDRLIRFYESV